MFRILQDFETVRIEHISKKRGKKELLNRLKPTPLYIKRNQATSVICEYLLKLDSGLNVRHVCSMYSIVCLQKK